MICSTRKHRIPFQIDESDWEAVSHYNWHLRRGYPTTAIGKQQTQRSLDLHIFLLGPAGSGLEWDHRNRDRLDNRRGNLRAVTRVVNQRNAGLKTNNSSGVNGVNWSRTRKEWEARIGVHGRQIHIGWFKSLESATAARRSSEAQLWGTDR